MSLRSSPSLKTIFTVIPLSEWTNLISLGASEPQEGQITLTLSLSLKKTMISSLSRTWACFLRISWRRYSLISKGKQRLFLLFPSFFQFEWDAIICFDERYKDFLRQVYPEGKIHIIPFPCHRWLEGDKEEARKKLALPLDKKIVFAFGQKWRHMTDEETVATLKELSHEYPLKLVIISGAQRVFGFEGLDCEIRKEVLEVPKLYDYLHAADVMIFGKHSIPNAAVLSSTVHLCLGSGCPILARDSNFFDFIDEEVFRYKDMEDFEQSLRSIFQGSAEVEEKRRATKRYCEANSGEKVAQRFIELFESGLAGM